MTRRRSGSGPRSAKRPSARAPAEPRSARPPSEPPSATESAPAPAVEPPPPRAVGPVRRLWRAWVGLWDRREAPISLALVRILVAVVLLADLLQARTYGLVEAIWGPPPDGLGWGGQGSGAPFAVRWLGASIETAWILWWAGAVSALMLLAGAASRVSALVLALVWAQLGYLAPDSDRGIDFMLRSVLLVLAVSPSHFCWSADAWVRRKLGRPFPALVAAWPRYLIFAQLVWVYFSAGHNKTDKAWGPLEGFTALANIMCDPHFARFDSSWVATLFPVIQLATMSTMVFELTSPIIILITYWYATRERPGRIRWLSNRLRLRWVWIATGAFFHVGIAVTMRLGIFPWGMLALYPVLFHPDELARAGAWLQARMPRRHLR